MSTDDDFLLHDKRKDLALNSGNTSNPLTIKDVIVKLIEKYPDAWLALPESIRQKMMDYPHDFKFITNFTSKVNSVGIRIQYKNVVMGYNYSSNDNGFWSIFDIINE